MTRFALFLFHILQIFLFGVWNCWSQPIKIKFKCTKGLIYMSQDIFEPITHTHTGWCYAEMKGRRRSLASFLYFATCVLPFLISMAEMCSVFCCKLARNKYGEPLCKTKGSKTLRANCSLQLFSRAMFCH